MSISITLSAGASASAAMAPIRPPERVAFAQLTKSLRSGDLDGAKAAYKSMVANAPPGASWNPDSPFAQLGRALKAGDLDAAKTAVVDMVRSRVDPPVESPQPVPQEPGPYVGGGVDLTA
jgi:hypothetical protein